MPFTHRILPPHRLGVLWFSGKITGDTLVEAAEVLVAQPDWLPGFDEVWDFLEIRSFAVSPSEMKALTTFESEQSDQVGHGRAFSITTDFFVRSVHKLLAATTSALGREHATFVSRADAAAVLGVAPDLLVP
jgi:hypothetical protein